jgi:septal ring-binding cell division protein DamX
MEDRESGNLSRKPALDLIVELHRGSVTGSLKLERAPLQKAVYFRDGQILFAASNDPKDQLASILVEEGKLGPDQMQVAQARVSPGNPLAKVLTELGYISQRELAEAARIKVEKILTDLYTWKEGTYQFATKSLPKGAIDLELSTSRLLFASIRRVQDRDWVLRQLGSLEAVLAPTASLPQFLSDTAPEPLAAEVLRLADGIKTVKQIGAVSSLGEFEVCKVLAAGAVAGALSRGAAVVPASDDAFSLPRAQESFDFPPPPKPSFGNETIGIPETESSPNSMSYDTIFQAAVVKGASPAEGGERAVLEPAPPRSGASALPAPPPPPARETSRGPTATELLIDEPEPASDTHGRNPPRPKTRRGGGGAGRSSSGLLKWLAGAGLAGAAVFSAYYFVWPLVGSGGQPGGVAARTPTTTSARPPTPAPGTAATGTTASPAPSPGAPTPSPATTTTALTDPRAGAAAAGNRPVTSSIARSAGAAIPPAATPPAPVPTPSTSGAPKPPTTAASTQRAASGAGDGRALLRSGNLAAAARAFQQEISKLSADRFTLALGLYCNEENASRLVDSASGSDEIYVLPTSVQGRSCYRVIWGLYDSRESAERNISSLPNGVRGGDVAAVAVSRFLR